MATFFVTFVGVGVGVVGVVVIVVVILMTNLYVLCVFFLDAERRLHLSLPLVMA